MTKSRVFLFGLLAFIAGIAFRSFVAMPVVLIWGFVLISAASILFGFFRKEKAAIIGGFLFLAALAGIFRFGQVEYFRPNLSPFYDKPLTLRGVVAEEPQINGASQQLKVKINSVDGGAVKPYFYSQIGVRRYPEYKIGDELSIRGVLKEPQNQGDFDYASYLAKDDIFSTVSFPLIEKVAENKYGVVRPALVKIKNAFESQINQILPEPHAAFLKGLLLGERASMPAELVENFKQTGTTHIIALSGYNITVVGRFFIALLSFLTIPFSISFWIATFGISLFVVMTGASSSLVRAAIMGVLMLLARREGRLYKMTNALAFAGAVMVFQNPRILRFDIAFQLSFLSTLGLLYLSPRTEKFLDETLLKFKKEKTSLGLNKSLEDKEKNGVFPFKQILVETVSAQLMVLPLLIYAFGRVSLISPLTNILVLIAVPYSMLIGFTSGLAAFLWQPLGQILGGFSWILLEYKIRVIEFFARLPLASLTIEKWWAVPLVIFYFYILVKLWFSAEKNKRSESV